MRSTLGHGSVSTHELTFTHLLPLRDASYDRTRLAALANAMISDPDALSDGPDAEENLYVPAGYEVTPAVAPDVLARALAAPSTQVLFLGSDARAIAVEESAFVPLETALLESPPWEPVTTETIETVLEEASLDLKVTSIGMLPLRGVERAPEDPSKTEA